VKLTSLLRGNDRGAISLRLALSAVLVGLSASVGIVTTGGLANADSENVRICHAGNSDSNPYQENTPANGSKIVEGHGSHDGPVWDPTLKDRKIEWGDIIPPFSYVEDGVTKSYAGKNWTTAGQEIYNNGCRPAFPDLRMLKTSTGGAVAGPMSSGSYFLGVANIGVGTAATGFTVSDTMPTGVVATAAAGGGWNCEVAALGAGVSCTHTGAALAPNESAVPITVSVTWLTPGTKVNSATVSRATFEPDSALANNTGTNTTVITAPVPDLTVEKSGQAKRFVGEEGSYTLTVTNSGTGPTSEEITVVDDLPDGVTALTSLPGGREAVGQKVTCRTSTPVAKDGSVSFVLPVAFGPPGTRVNKVKVSGGGELNTGNNTDDFTTTVVGRPDLTVEKTGPTTKVQGSTGTYTLTATNSGGSPTTANITVVDDLPAGVTAQTLPQGCSLSEQKITCVSASVLDLGGQVAFDLDVTFNDLGTRINTATVSGGGETKTDNNTATFETEVTATAVPDLTVEKSGQAQRSEGEEGSYTLTVTNSGTGPTSEDIVVLDTLPTGVSIVEPLPDECEADDQKVTCTTDEVLLVDGSVSFELSVTFETHGTRVNNVTVSGGGEARLNNNTDSFETTVAGRPDLTVQKTGPVERTEGDTGSYTIKVMNSGTAPTSGEITAVDDLPDGVSFGSPLPVACALSGDGRQVTCSTTDVLAVEGFISFELPVTFDEKGEQVNRVGVFGGGETKTTNNAAEATTDVAGHPDLTLAKTGPAERVEGDAGSYTLTVSNEGNEPTSAQITVVDTLPAGVEPGSPMPAEPFGCTASGKTVTCTIDQVLEIGGSTSTTFPVTFTSPGTVTNNATVSGGGQVNIGNDTASFDTTVAGRPDLALAMAGPESVIVGDGGEYDLTVSNVGTATATPAITLTDTLPAGVRYAPAMSQARWSGLLRFAAVDSVFTTGVFSCSVSGQTLTCTTDEDLAVGDTLAATFPVTFNALGRVTNPASVSGGDDVSPGNNDAFAVTAVAGRLDLAVVKSGPASAVENSNGVYSVAVTNQGSAPSGPFTVTDTLTAGQQATAASGNGYTCTVAVGGGSVSCTHAGLAAGQSAGPLVITVAFGVAGTVSNTAAVPAVDDETDTSDNSSIVETVLDEAPVPTPGEPDLNIVKSGPATAAENSTGAYGVAVTNQGAEPSGPFTVTDTLSAGQRATGASGDAYSCTVASDGSSVSCTHAGLAAGESAAPLVITVAFGGAGAVSDTVTIPAVPGEGDEADNTSRVDTVLEVVPVPAEGRADLSIVKTGPTSAVAPGALLTYVLTVGNDGDAAATEVVVEDELQNGLTLVSATGDGFDCALLGPNVSCAYDDDLAVGDTAVVTVVARLSSSYDEDTVSNTATVGPTDARPGNNTDTVATDVVPVEVLPNPPIDRPQPTSPTPATVAPTSPAPTVRQSPAAVAAAAPTRNRPAALPFTGVTVDQQLATGAGLLLLGVVMALGARRRRSSTPPVM
jgi:uncharacterized repeat protein (TIGR01451 family)